MYVKTIHDKRKTNSKKNCRLVINQRPQLNQKWFLIPIRKGLVTLKEIWYEIGWPAGGARYIKAMVNQEEVILISGITLFAFPRRDIISGRFDLRYLVILYFDESFLSQAPSAVVYINRIFIL